MAPTRTVKSKHLKAGPGAKRSSSSSTPSSKTGAAKSGSRSGPKSGVSNSTRRKATHGASTTSRKKKQRVYTAKELGVPRLNTVTPVGVQAPRGKKKGKVFVDSGESMMTILAMVNADKEGQIESKMMKARQMEEIREARKKEAEARQEERKSKFEDTKDSMRKRRKRRSDHTQDDAVGATAVGSATSRGSKLKKRVSFA